MIELRIGIIMNGVTGRMGTNQHLVRSINAIRAEGGVPLAVFRVVSLRRLRIAAGLSGALKFIRQACRRIAAPAAKVEVGHGLVA